jgi:hypothetical protein
MEEERITKYPSESFKSDNEYDENGEEMTEDRDASTSKYDPALMSDSKSTISSTAISRTETPDEQDFGLPIGGIMREQQDDPEKLKEDIAARGIIRSGQYLSKDSALKGSMISTVLSTENQSTSQTGLDQDLTDKPESPIPLQTAVVAESDLTDSRPSSASTNSSVEIPFKTDDSEPKKKESFHTPELVKVGERETSFMTRPGNLKVELSSICTQTDNSWLKDLEFYEEISHFKPEWIDEMKTIKHRKESKSSTGN